MTILDIREKTRLMEGVQLKPQMKLKGGKKLSEQVAFSEIQGGGKKFNMEFIGVGTFGTEWNVRQQYEVDAGRDEEPTVYEPLYAQTMDAGLPKNITINRMGPAGVFFSAVPEGSEIPLASIGASQQSIPLIDYAVGLEYTLDLIRYNQMWDIAQFERQIGIAHNALLNEIHLAPFISYSYTSANQTAASAVGANLGEKYLRTLEDAITAAKTDTSNPRRGPYYLLISANNMFTMERALRGTNLSDVDMQSSARALIRGIIVYDGWTGTMNNESVSYTGVSANKAYLIDVSPEMKRSYARSYVKFLMDRLDGESDMSRRIANQVFWWSSVGTYVSPAATTEEITLPTS